MEPEKVADGREEEVQGNPRVAKGDIKKTTKTEDPNREGWVIKSELVRLNDGRVNAEGLLKLAGNSRSLAAAVLFMLLISTALSIVHVVNMGQRDQEVADVSVYQGGIHVMVLLIVAVVISAINLQSSWFLASVLDTACTGGEKKKKKKNQ